MTSARQLLSLQDLDILLDGVKQRLADIQRRLGDRNAIEEAKSALRHAEEQRKDVLKQQRGIEIEVEDMAAKDKALRDKMYSGTVTNSKELAAMLQESEQLQAVIKRKEDDLLELMLQGDQLSALVQELGIRSKEVESRWLEERDKLLEAKAAAESELRSLEGRRSTMVERIDAAPLSIYQALREDKRGIAVAKVERGMCMGCRITLPARELQRARSGRELARCPSCGRILLVS